MQTDFWAGRAKAFFLAGDGSQTMKSLPVRPPFPILPNPLRTYTLLFCIAGRPLRPSGLLLIGLSEAMRARLAFARGGIAPDFAAGLGRRMCSRVLRLYALSRPSASISYSSLSRLSRHQFDLVEDGLARARARATITGQAEVPKAAYARSTNWRCARPWID